MKKNNILFQKIIVYIVIFWLFFFIFIPNLGLIFISFFQYNAIKIFDFILTFDNYKEIFNPVYYRVMLYSIYISFFSTLLCLLIGYPFSLILATVVSKKWISVMLFLLILPFWTNSLIRIYALKIFFSKNGYLNSLLLSVKLINQPIDILYTEVGVIIGLVYLLLPFMIIPLFSSIQKIDKNCIEAAFDLGANRLRVFFSIIFPLTISGVISGSLLVFLSSIGLFYVSDIIGGSRNLLIGNIIKNQFLYLRNWPFGSAMSIFLIFIMIIVSYIYYHILILFNKK
ncbi:MAG: spermidine/putrescine ABC transporter permease PotB [Arsenophonus sp.]|nr:MAG: spermidine/putrescine ABC transporter permease PotB [Arsenophonus sp.]